MHLDMGDAYVWEKSRQQGNRYVSSYPTLRGGRGRRRTEAAADACMGEGWPDREFVLATRLPHHGGLDAEKLTVAG